MASYAWARSRSLLSRFSLLRVQTISNEKVEIERPKADFDGKLSSNERYLAALKDGGIWLS